MILKPEKIDDLSPEKRKTVMERSMEDISSIFEDVRKIVLDVKNGAMPSPWSTTGNTRKISTPPTWRSPRKKSRAPMVSWTPRWWTVSRSLRKTSPPSTGPSWSARCGPSRSGRGSWQAASPGPWTLWAATSRAARAVYPSSILMTVLPAKVAGRRGGRGRHPPLQRHGGQSRHPGGGRHCRLRPHLQGGRPVGRGRPGLRHRDHAQGGQDRRPRQQICHGRKDAGLRAGGHRLPRRARARP